MNLRSQIEKLLKHGGPRAYLVIQDLLEGEGWPAEGWDALLELLPGTDSNVRIPYSPIWFDVLKNLAAHDYERAVQIYARLDYERGDYATDSAIVDAMNTAHCVTNNTRTGTWQERLDLQRMEQVTMETGGDLGPWITEERRFRYATDFAPEYLQHELQQRYGWDATFHTAFHDDGGNFGPSFIFGTLHDGDGLWRSIRHFGFGEAECPWLGMDESDVVTLESTFCGEHPGKECAMCGQPLGEHHRVVYLGEGGGEVFILDVLARISHIDLIEEDGWWEIRAFDDEDDVEIPRSGVGPQPDPEDADRANCTRLFSTHIDDSTAPTLELAHQKVNQLLQNMGRTDVIVREVFL